MVAMSTEVAAERAIYGYSRLGGHPLSESQTGQVIRFILDHGAWRRSRRGEGWTVSMRDGTRIDGTPVEFETSGREFQDVDRGTWNDVTELHAWYTGTEFNAGRLTLNLAPAVAHAVAELLTTT